MNPGNTPRRLSAVGVSHAIVGTVSLTPADCELHAQIGVTLDTLLRQQIHRLDDREARELLSINGRPGRMDGVIYPYLDPVDHHVATRRLRRDHPEIEAGRPRSRCAFRSR
jgi:hypothetical protein